MEAINLTQVPAVDNHCHGIARDQTFEDMVGWRMAFTESTDPGMARDHVASTSSYRRLIPTLADFLGCVPEEEAVFVARTGRDGARRRPLCEIEAGAPAQPCCASF